MSLSAVRLNDLICSIVYKKMARWTTLYDGLKVNIDSVLMQRNIGLVKCEGSFKHIELSFDILSWWRPTLDTLIPDFS